MKIIKTASDFKTGQLVFVHAKSILRAPDDETLVMESVRKIFGLNGRKKVSEQSREWFPAMVISEPKKISALLNLLIAGRIYRTNIYNIISSKEHEKYKRRENLYQARNKDG
jgi:hypothetical protein